MLVYVTGLLKTHVGVRQRTGGYDSDPTFETLPDKSRPLQQWFVVSINENPAYTDKDYVDHAAARVKRMKSDVWMHVRVLYEDEFYDDMDAYDITLSVNDRDEGDST